MYHLADLFLVPTAFERKKKRDGEWFAAQILGKALLASTNVICYCRDHP